MRYCIEGRQKTCSSLTWLIITITPIIIITILHRAVVTSSLYPSPVSALSFGHLSIFLVGDLRVVNPDGDIVGDNTVVNQYAEHNGLKQAAEELAPPRQGSGACEAIHENVYKNEARRRHIAPACPVSSNRADSGATGGPRKVPVQMRMHSAARAEESVRCGPSRWTGLWKADRSGLPSRMLAR